MSVALKADGRPTAKVGIDDELLRNLSQRRGEIDEAVAELEAAIGRTKSVDELQSIVLATRLAHDLVQTYFLPLGR